MFTPPQNMPLKKHILDISKPYIHRSPAEAGKGNGLQSEYLILIRLLGEQTVITGDYF
jgi:hypothetical protein